MSKPITGAEELSGFVVAAITTPSLIFTGFADTALKVVITAIISGFVGAIFAYFGRKLMEKIEAFIKRQ
jgi:hypothetical protein